MLTGTCPECDADVEVEPDADRGDQVSCAGCGSTLELAGQDPVELTIVEPGSEEAEVVDPET